MTRFAVAIFFAAISLGASAQDAVPAPPQVAAKAYILMDAATGTVLAEHEADLQLHPASLTKMMTSYILAREITEGRVSADDKVVISNNAWSQNPIFAGSSLMYIEPGMEVAVSDLERGIIISSGNDATLAIAEHLAGSEDVFAEMMNTTAAKLGMTNTFYVNSHGLPDPQHLTTARDLAILARAAIRDYPEHYAIYKERDFTFNNIRQDNRNMLLGEDPTVDGIKTGHTDDAGYCLVASAQREGMRLIAVVMGTASKRARANESRALLNYGFRFYETATPVAAMTELARPRVWKGKADHVAVGVLDDLQLTVQRGRAEALEPEVVLDEPLQAPLAVGDRVGTLTLTLDGKTVLQQPVTALAAVEAGGFFARLWDTILMFFSELFRA